LNSRLTDIPLEANDIFPLGLIANVLVTNAIKHAFPDGQAGTINVRLNRIEPGFCELIVADDGRGLPENVNPETSTGFGLTLISALTSQIKGRLLYRREAGTEVRVIFPIPVISD